MHPLCTIPVVNIKYFIEVGSILPGVHITPSYSITTKAVIMILIKFNI